MVRGLDVIIQMEPQLSVGAIEEIFVHAYCRGPINVLVTQHYSKISKCNDGSKWSCFLVPKPHVGFDGAMREFPSVGSILRLSQYKLACFRTRETYMVTLFSDDYEVIGHGEPSADCTRIEDHPNYASTRSMDSPPFYFRDSNSNAEYYPNGFEGLPSVSHNAPTRPESTEKPGHNQQSNAGNNSIPTAQKKSDGSLPYQRPGEQGDQPTHDNSSYKGSHTAANNPPNAYRNDCNGYNSTNGYDNGYNTSKDQGGRGPQGMPQQQSNNNAGYGDNGYGNANKSNYNSYNDGYGNDSGYGNAGGINKGNDGYNYNNSSTAPSGYNKSGYGESDYGERGNDNSGYGGGYGNKAQANNMGGPQDRAPMGKVGGANAMSNFLGRGSSVVVKPSMNNSGNTLSINDINIHQSVWTIKAKVSTKSELKKWSSNSATAKTKEGVLFSIDLIDEKGDEIKCVFFNKGAEMFYPIIQENRVYTFSKGQVRQANQKFNRTGHSCELSFDENSEIILCDNQANNIPSKKYRFVKISDVYTTQPNTYIDVIGVVVAFTPTTTITIKSTGMEKEKKSITIIDDSNRSIEVSLWGNKATELSDPQLAYNPIIAIKSVRVAEYNNNVSLNSVSNTTFEINPDIDRAMELLHCKKQGTISMNATAPSGNAFVNVSRKLIDTLGDGAEETTAQIVGFISYIPNNLVPGSDGQGRKVYYDACSKCRRKVEDIGNDTWSCSNCQTRNAVNMRRWLLRAELCDFSGDIKADIFHDQAHTLLNLTADEAYASPDGFNSAALNAIDNCIYSRWKFKIKTKQENYLEEVRTKHVCTAVEKFHPVEEANSYYQLLMKTFHNIDNNIHLMQFDQYGSMGNQKSHY